MQRRRSAPAGAAGPRARATALAARLSAAVVAPQAVVATFAGAIYCTAGLVGVLTPLFPQEPEVQTAQVQALAAAALVTGLALLRWGRHLAPWSAHLLVLGGTAAIALAVAWSGPTPTGIALNCFFIFVALDCGLFFTRVVGWLHLAVALAACVGGLAAQSPTAVGAGVITSVTALIVAAGTGWLVRMAAAANVDPLTGLSNRRHLDEALQAAVERSDRTRTPLSVALLDLDHFKAVNDTQGHAEGDGLLQSVTSAWTPLLAPGQLLARQGGDEFVLVMPGARLDEAVSTAERLRRAMPAGSTCSVGVAQHWHGEGARPLLRRADAALYQVKRTGRDATGSTATPAAPR